MAEEAQDLGEKEEERKERIREEKDRLNRLLDQVITRLTDIPLAKGIDQNSWLYAGCRQDLEAARTRILNYIERVLK